MRMGEKKELEALKSQRLHEGGAYTGGTTGAGGVRYYIIKEIAEHNNADIKVQDSELGGARFEVYLKKA